MRLLSWNVARYLKKLDDQADAITTLGVDAILLQEITAASLPRWREHLRAAGYAEVTCSLDTAPAVREPAGPRRHGVLVATRDAHAVRDGPRTPWPEVAHVVETAGLQLCGLHAPNSRNGTIKVLTLEAVRDFALARQDAALVVCGDLNTPRKEHPDGRIWTFARDQYGRLREERGERWDAAELALLDGSAGLRDLFRELHGREVTELSWEWPRWGGGYRLDHVLATRPVTAAGCGYLHELRARGLSDHSAVVAEVSA